MPSGLRAEAEKMKMMNFHFERRLMRTTKSKYCPKCRRIVSSNNIPNYCAWGCGSLKDQPLIPSDISLLDYLALMREQEKNSQKTTQLKLF